MTRAFTIVLLAAGLAACASQRRTEPPAPVVTAGRAPAATAEQQTSGSSAQPGESVEVYAYRPPSAAPDAPPPQGSVPAESGRPADGSPMSESAATGSPGTPALQSAPAGPASSPGSVPAPVPPATPAPQVVAYAPPPPAAPSLLPAADVLARHAEQQRQAGDYVGSAATLERALRIQPQEASEQAYLWNRLARVRMEQGLYSQAGNLASRSNALSKDQPSLKQDNWSVIAAARRAAGDTAGAAEAERKARGG